MADEKTPATTDNIVHKIAAPIGSALKKTATDLASSKILSGIGTGIKWTVNKATLVTGVQHAASALKFSFSPTTWYVGAFWVLVLIGGYVWGHHEEAKNATAVFSRLSACVSSLNEATKPVSVPVCAPAPEVAPAPAVEPAPAASPEPKAATPRHKKRASPGLLGGLFGK